MQVGSGGASVSKRADIWQAGARQALESSACTSGGPTQMRTSPKRAHRTSSRLYVSAQMRWSGAQGGSGVAHARNRRSTSRCTPEARPASAAARKAASSVACARRRAAAVHQRPPPWHTRLAEGAHGAGLTGAHAVRAARRPGRTRRFAAKAPAGAQACAGPAAERPRAAPPQPSSAVQAKSAAQATASALAPSAKTSVAVCSSVSAATAAHSATHWRSLRQARTCNRSVARRPAHPVARR